MEKEKAKSIVVKETTWKRLSEKLHFEGLSTMDSVIACLLDYYEKEENDKM